MRTSSFSVFAVFGILAFSFTHPAYAELDASKVDLARATGAANYEAGAKAFNKTIAFSLIQSQGRVKLPGQENFYLDGGFGILDVDEANLGPLTDSGKSPSAFQTLFLKAGLGLPLGLAIEAGVSQVVSDHMMNALIGSVSYQLLDFSTWTYTDFIPSTSMSVSAMRTFSGPGEYVFAGQANIGAYHQHGLAQFAYAFQYTYSILTSTEIAVSKASIRHGIISHVPLFTNWFIRMEIFYPMASGTVFTGYQF